MTSIIGFSKERDYFVNNFKNKKLSNSIILSGQKGIGKNSFVLNLIKEFYKISISKNIDHHLNLIDNKTHPNVKYLCREIDTKTKKLKKFITIDQIRKLNNFFYESSLIKDLNKIIIIDSADELNISAANTILKMLEEPKINTYIFLISHQISSLLPTIRSRCLKVNLKNHKFDSFKIIVEKKLDNFEIEYLHFLYDISNGSPGIAMLFDNKEIIDLFDDVTLSIISSDPFSNDNVILSSKIAQFENEKLFVFFSIIKFILLNLSKLKIGVNIFDQFMSVKIKNLLKASKSISQKTILKKLEYLINNENDLFRYNLDKKLFILNFFAETE